MKRVSTGTLRTYVAPLPPHFLNKSKFYIAVIQITVDKFSLKQYINPRQPCGGVAVAKHNRWEMQETKAATQAELFLIAPVCA